MKKVFKEIGIILAIYSPFFVLLECTPKKTEAPLPILVQSYVDIVQNDTSIKVGEMIQLDANYVNEQDESSKNVNFVWSTSNSTILDLGNTGLAKGKSVGQAYIYVEFSGKRDTVLFTVLPSATGINTDTSIATIIITTEGSNSVKIGENLQLLAKAYNSSGFELAGKVFNWSSSLQSIGTINGSGLLTGISSGTTNVRASSQNVQSIDLLITVNGGEATSRKGNFIGKEGHSCTGSATIYIDNGGNVKIDFASNFVCQGGPDLRVYLSNVANGSGVSSSGIELALLKSNSGAQTYNVPSGVKLSDYNYIIVHCKQFNTSFGSAQLD